MAVTDRGERGFTLIEMLVALAVFSLAALSLLKLQGVSLRTAADLDARVVADVVAQNLAVEALTDPVAPAIGRSGGVRTNGGRNWRWTRLVSATPDATLLRVDLVVQGDAPAARSALTLVRWRA